MRSMCLTNQGSLSSSISFFNTSIIYIFWFLTYRGLWDIHKTHKNVVLVKAWQKLTAPKIPKPQAVAFLLSMTLNAVVQWGVWRINMPHWTMGDPRRCWLGATGWKWCIYQVYILYRWTFWMHTVHFFAQCWQEDLITWSVIWLI